MELEEAIERLEDLQHIMLTSVLREDHRDAAAISRILQYIYLNIEKA